MTEMCLHLSSGRDQSEVGVGENNAPFEEKAHHCSLNLEHRTGSEWESG